MSAFNSLNGVPATGNEFTLREVLRGEWKFDGFVVSDWDSVIEMIPHGFAADRKEAAMKAIRAGVDMEMVSTSYFENYKSLIDSGQVTMKQIDEAVRNILRVKFRLGLFDRGPELPQVSNSDALDIAKRLATESVVLLKNDRATASARKRHPRRRHRSAGRQPRRSDGLVGDGRGERGGADPAGRAAEAAG